MPHAILTPSISFITCLVSFKYAGVLATNDCKKWSMYSPTLKVSKPVTLGGVTYSCISWGEIIGTQTAQGIT